MIKIGRTHLQDATPIRLGQEFSGYARQVAASAERIEAALRRHLRIAARRNGGRHGLERAAGIRAATIAEIARRTGLPFVEAPQSFRGAGGARCGLLSERRAAHLRGRADEDRERHPLARVGSALRARRAAAARGAAGVEHHAGEGESR